MKQLLDKIFGISNAYKAKVKELEATNKVLQGKADQYEQIKAENDTLKAERAEAISQIENFLNQNDEPAS